MEGEWGGGGGGEGGERARAGAGVASEIEDKVGGEMDDKVAVEDKVAAWRQVPWRLILKSH